MRRMPVTRLPSSRLRSCRPSQRPSKKLCMQNWFLPLGNGCGCSPQYPSVELVTRPLHWGMVKDRQLLPREDLARLSPRMVRIAALPKYRTGLWLKLKSGKGVTRFRKRCLPSLPPSSHWQGEFSINSLQYPATLICPQFTNASSEIAQKELPPIVPSVPLTVQTDLIEPRLEKDSNVPISLNCLLNKRLLPPSLTLSTSSYSLQVTSLIPEKDPPSPTMKSPTHKKPRKVGHPYARASSVTIREIKEESTESSRVLAVDPQRLP
uniref:Uncharacterized protein C21C3.14c n=2 Tax=Anthurium amnicola TaxID=1678845 RepID=A0A1D1Z403_9ARAE